MKEFDKIIGYDAIKNELVRLCDILVNPEKYEKFDIKVPQGLLLYGEPGVGKTLMAECFIKASKRKCYKFRKVNDKFEEEICSLFDKAKENAPSIVFLDDMDRFASGDEMEGSVIPEFSVIQNCIDYVKDSDVFVVATANDIKCFPDSLVRVGRFSKCLEIEKPEGKDCEKIMQYYLSKKKNLEKFDYVEFSKILNGMTCAELESIINEAGMYAAFDGKDVIEKSDMLKACLRNFYESPEESLWEVQNPNEIKRVAYHEAGHAVVAEILREESVSITSIANHTGSIGGITKNYFDEDKCWPDLDFRIRAIKCLLAGKAATEVVFGEVDFGSGRDLSLAFHRLEKLIDDNVMLGFDSFSSKTDGDEKRDRLSYLVSKEIERYYKETKKLLIDNREFLDKIANALLENTTLLMNDIQAIKKTCKIVG